MMRLLIVGISAIVATLSGSYLARHFLMEGKPSAPPKAEEPLEVMKLEPVTVPVIRRGSVQGYVIVMAALAVAQKDGKDSRPLIMAVASEAVFRSIFEKETDMASLKTFEIEPLTTRISDLANARIGRRIVKAISIESINFVQPSDTRNGGRR